MLWMFRRNINRLTELLRFVQITATRTLVATKDWDKQCVFKTKKITENEYSSYYLCCLCGTQWCTDDEC